MTVTEATRILRPPLRFGDPSQVNARKFLEMVATAKECVQECDANHEEKVQNSRWPEEHVRIIALCGCLEYLKEGDAKEVARALVSEWSQR